MSYEEIDQANQHERPQTEVGHHSDPRQTKAPVSLLTKKVKNGRNDDKGSSGTHDK